MFLLTYPCRIWKGKPLLFYQSRGTWQRNHWCTRKRFGFQISLSDLEEGKEPMFCISFSDHGSCGLVFSFLLPLLLSGHSATLVLWSCDICFVLIDMLNIWGYYHFQEFLEIKELSRLSCFLLEFPLDQV